MFRGEKGGMDILRVLSECTYQMYCCLLPSPMRVMNHIKQVLVELNLVKGLKKKHMVKVIANG
jgi:hypothetical protein